jgi:hypothetical protein
LVERGFLPVRIRPLIVIPASLAAGRKNALHFCKTASVPG